DESMATRAAAIWRWNGSSYDTQIVGFLPGTVLTMGQAYLVSVTDDGQIAVGSNVYTMSPGGPRDGMVWTPATRLAKDTDYLLSLGLSVPQDMDISEFDAISADGSTIAGLGRTAAGFQTFIIHLNGVCSADLNGDGLVDFADYLEFLNLFDAGDVRVDFT